MAFFPVAGIVVVTSFLILKSWRAIFIVLLLIPMSICLIFAYFFVQ